MEMTKQELGQRLEQIREKYKEEWSQIAWYGHGSELYRYHKVQQVELDFLFSLIHVLQKEIERLEGELETADHIIQDYLN